VEKEMNLTSDLIEAHIFRMNGDDLEFLLLKRAESEVYPGMWQMVTGSSDQNEKAFETALREIKEESGLIPKKFWVVPNINSFYRHEKDKICVIPVFAALVDENGIVIISEEHCDFKWVKKSEAINSLAWPGQVKSVEIIYDYFINKKSILNFVEIPF
jgi:dihydroneopterin triphosphate diphosphatase